MLAFLVMLAGAAAVGLFVFQLHKTKRWFAFEILALGAHGLMLVAMALHSIGLHFISMELIGVLASLPMLARLAVKTGFGGDAAK